MSLRKYVRPEEKIAREFRSQRAGIRDVQRPTGTEKHQTKDTAIAAAASATVALEKADQVEADLVEARDDLTQTRTDLEDRLDAAEADITGAQATADEAQEAADTAATTAASKAAIFTGVGEPQPVDGEGQPYPAGSVYWETDEAGQVVAYWRMETDTWDSHPFSEAIIPQIEIGSGTYGELSGERLLAKSVGAEQIEADAITALTAEIDQAFIQSAHVEGLDVSKLVVSGSASMSEAVIQRLFADVVKARIVQITDELLAADGTFTGRVTASHLDVESLFGARIDGLEIHGGEFIQYATDDLLPIYPDPASVVEVSDWVGGSPTALAAAVSDSLRETGTESALVSRAGAGSVSALWVNNDRVPPVGAAARRVEVRVRSTVALTGVHVTTAHGSVAQPDVPANTWVTLSANVPQGAALTWVHVGGDAASSAELRIDRLTVLSASLSGAHVRISRDEAGMPGMFIFNAAGQPLAQLTPQGVRSQTPSGDAAAVLHHGELSFSDGTDLAQLTHDGLTLSGDTPTELSRDLFQFGGLVQMTGRVEGVNRFASKSLMDAWTSAPAGTEAWVIPESRKYVRTASAWVPIAQTQRVLWHNNSGWYMTATQTATLSENVSAQATGIITVWSRYASESASNTNFHYEPIPKWHVSGAPSAGAVSFSMHNNGNFLRKYIDVYDNRLVGYASNSQGNDAGLVLRWVIGY